MAAYEMQVMLRDRQIAVYSDHPIAIQLEALIAPLWSDGLLGYSLFDIEVILNKYPATTKWAARHVRVSGPQNNTLLKAVDEKIGELANWLDAAGVLCSIGKSDLRVPQELFCGLVRLTTSHFAADCHGTVWLRPSDCSLLYIDVLVLKPFDKFNAYPPSRNKNKSSRHEQPRR